MMFSKTTSLYRQACLILLFGLFGCGGVTDGVESLDATSAPTIELVGEWETSTGETAFITEKMWGLDTIWSFDNTENSVITQTASNAGGSANKYNKILWTDVVNDSFYVCYVLFGYASFEEVNNAEYEADSTDPAAGGCNGLPWFFFIRKSPSSEAAVPPGDFVDGG